MKNLGFNVGMVCGLVVALLGSATMFFYFGWGLFIWIIGVIIMLGSTFEELTKEKGG